VLEHLLLTFTLLLLGEASGFSTLFGALSNATLWTYRVWWHFAINLFATVYATRAAKAMYDEGLVLSGPMRRTAIPQI
jgi:hypothetical protein